MSHGKDILFLDSFMILVMLFFFMYSFFRSIINSVTIILSSPGGKHLDSHIVGRLRQKLQIQRESELQ